MSKFPVTTSCIIFRKEILEIRRGKADLCKDLRVINWPALKLVSHTNTGFHLENSSIGTKCEYERLGFHNYLY